MAIRCENAGQFGAYSRRGTGNQRHTLSHDLMLLNELQDMRLTTRAYALSGMQATCKPPASVSAYSNAQYSRMNGNILRSIAPGSGRLSGTLKLRHVRYRAIDTSKCQDRSVSDAAAAISQSPVTATGRLPATRCFRSIGSPEDTPSRSAARQTTLSSNSLTWPSA